MWGNRRGRANRPGLTLLLTLLVLLPLGFAGARGPSRPANIAPQVWEETAGGNETTFLVVLREQADLSDLPPTTDHTTRVRLVVERLQAVATREQARLRAMLDRRGIPYRPFYVANLLAVTGDRRLLVELADRPEVARIVANPSIEVPLPHSLPSSGPLSLFAVQWNVQKVHADAVWAQGYTGEGVVVAGQDTGYDWDHPALVGAYRGWNGTTVSHDYNWHDAIHSDNPNTPPGNPCGFDSPKPCDDNGHGTHTMGTMVGAGGIGVAPGARWIGCRNMEQGWGTPASYIECFEFFLAPYPVGGNPFTDGQPDKAPDVINNSWYCPPEEGCDWGTLQTVVGNVRAAGILVVVSAGNDGSGCNTVRYPPAIYEAAFSVGATDSADNIASFSSRGPVTVDGSERRKPDVSAPGVGIYSSLPGGGYGSMNGTSMAAPHVAGVAALLWSAAPELLGDVERTETILEQTARPRTSTQGCGGDGPEEVPNNVYGWGIVDALAAVTWTRLEISKQASLSPGVPIRWLTYTLTAINASAETLTNVVLTDAIPSGLPLAWASGVYTEQEGVITWAPTTLESGDALTATFALTVAHLLPGTPVVNERYGVRADGIDAPISGPPVEVVIPWRMMLPLVVRDL